VTEETNQLGDARQFTYNAAGLLTRRVDRRGWVREFTFDNLYRNTGEIWYDSATDADADQNRQNTFSFTYDALGRMLTAGDAAADYTYTYDSLGRVTRIEQDITGLDPTVTLTAQYDAAGRRTRLAAAIGATDDFQTDTTYDHLGRVATVKQQGQTGGNAVAEKYVDFLFDSLGRPDELTRYADLAGTDLVAETDFVFDHAGRLTDITHAKGGTTFADYDLVYDRAGQMTDFDFTSLVGDSGDADYTHDDTGQLTGSDYSGDWQSDESYQYDENGNRETAGGDTYTTGSNNQLLSDGTYRYEYDEEGNRTLRFVDTDSSGTLTAGDTDITAYAWDHRNRLTKVSHFATQTDYAGEDPDQIVEYAYDFGQRWVRKVLDSDGDGVADENRIFVHDGVDNSPRPLAGEGAGVRAPQIILDFQDTTTPTNDAAASDLAHRYLWGPRR
jgi:YD repeat-containing protein